MRLPKADAVEISREKITEYLLNPLHPDGAGKAQFFIALGFTVEEYLVLADALRQLAADFPVVKSTQSRYGIKYVVDGELQTPIGKTPTLRTVWIIDDGAETPRLITAYPQDKGAS